MNQFFDEIKIVAVDFDNTLTLDNPYPEVGKPNLEAIEILKEFRNNGGKVILWSCRYGEPLEKALALCKTYGLVFDAINDNLPEQTAKWRAAHPDDEMMSMSRKIYADLYIDDRDPRNLIRGGVDWNAVCMLLHRKTLDMFNNRIVEIA